MVSPFCHFPIGDWSLCPDYAGIDAITKAALAHTGSDGGQLSACRPQEDTVRGRDQSAPATGQVL